MCYERKRTEVSASGSRMASVAGGPAVSESSVVIVGEGVLLRGSGIVRGGSESMKKRTTKMAASMEMP